jgi:RNA polymerase subunit RPABC4/transcription elongation factor Spt4
MSPDLINNIATFAGVIVAALGAFIFAFWVAMGIWTFNDIRSRTRDWLAILLAVLLVMVFPIVGLILYSLIRPKATLADTYDRALEEEALLRELEETQACQSCGIPVKDGWIFCPNCHTQLQHSCPACTNLIRNEWAICVYCGTPQRGAQPRELGAREMQGSYQPSQTQRPTLEGQPSPQFGPALSGAPAASESMGALQPAPAQRRSSRNPFGAPAPSQPAPSQSSPSQPAPQQGSGSMPTSTGQSSSMEPGQSSLPPRSAPMAPPFSPTDYDDSPYRPARAGEG